MKRPKKPTIINRTFKSVNALVSHISSKTFKAYWHEMRRHEAVLQRIYGKDKLHKHVPEEVGSVHQVHPTKRHIVTFRRCAICMKDMPPTTL